MHLACSFVFSPVVRALLIEERTGTDKIIQRIVVFWCSGGIFLAGRFERREKLDFAFFCGGGNGYRRRRLGDYRRRAGGSTGHGFMARVEGWMCVGGAQRSNTFDVVGSGRRRNGVWAAGAMSSGQFRTKQFVLLFVQ